MTENQTEFPTLKPITYVSKAHGFEVIDPADGSTVLAVDRIHAKDFEGDTWDLDGRDVAGSFGNYRDAVNAAAKALQVAGYEWELVAAQVASGKPAPAAPAPVGEKPVRVSANVYEQGRPQHFSVFDATGEKVNGCDRFLVSVRRTKGVWVIDRPIPGHGVAHHSLSGAAVAMSAFLTSRGYMRVDGVGGHLLALPEGMERGTMKLIELPKPIFIPTGPIRVNVESEIDVPGLADFSDDILRAVRKAEGDMPPIQTVTPGDKERLDAASTTSTATLAPLPAPPALSVESLQGLKARLEADLAWVTAQLR